jgi:hypothetical protein
LGGQDAAEPDVARIRQNLEGYLGSHTEIIIP